jgi:hypothetical protein
MTVAGTQDKVNAAVRECIGECFFSPNPAACLAQYINALRFRRGWSTAEVHDVQCAAVRILAAIAEGDDDQVPFGFSLQARF